MNENEVKLSKKDFEELLVSATKTAVEAQIKELGLDKVDRKFGNVPASFIGVDEETLAKMDKKQRVAQFIKAVFHKDVGALAQLKAMSEGTNGAGGFLVPDEFAAEVNRVVEDFGLVPKLATKYTMGSDTLNVPRLSATVTVSYPGENTAGTASQPTLQQVQLLAKTLVGITPMSNELLADANVDVVDLLVTLFAEAIAGQLDSQGLAGSGSPFTGVLNDAGVTVVTPAAGNSTFTLCATPDNLRTLISQVKPWALQGAGFIMHRNVWEIIQTKKSSGGDYFISTANPVLTGIAGQGFPTAAAGTLWGYPVYLSDKMTGTTAVSTKFVIFGNLKYLFMGQRNQMAVDISRDGVIGSDSLFEKNMSAVRVTTRHALAVGLPTAFAVLSTSAT